MVQGKAKALAVPVPVCEGSVSCYYAFRVTVRLKACMRMAPCVPSLIPNTLVQYLTILPSHYFYGSVKLWTVKPSVTLGVIIYGC